MERTFPRAKQKSIIKKHQYKARFSRNADILVRFSCPDLCSTLQDAGDIQVYNIQRNFLFIDFSRLHAVSKTVGY